MFSSFQWVQMHMTSAARLSHTENSQKNSIVCSSFDRVWNHYLYLWGLWPVLLLCSISFFLKLCTIQIYTQNSSGN